MQNAEFEQLELLASLDRLRQRVRDWTTSRSLWEPVARSQAVLDRVLKRVETLQIRYEAPLVIATFGGTGTGKSTLVNALVGQEVSQSGRQRPTTRMPVLIAHTDTDLSALQLPLNEVEVVTFANPVLKDFLVIDCPDPDTSETSEAGTNLDRLRSLLPYCDVLLVVSTQQKYRSARVTDELQAAASGCRMVFVQTHADLDEDIRSDWRTVLSEDYEVPDLFFIDSMKAFDEQRQGLEPTGEFGRLLRLLTSELGASQRVRLRRANIVDLLQVGLSRTVETIDASTGPLKELSDVLNQQRISLSERMSLRLRKELMTSHGLWERRLLDSVNEHWGASPFSTLLRVYNGLGGILASLTFFRARSTAQLALLGTIQGKRWLDSLRQEQQTEESLHRVSRFGLDESHLREAEIVVSGYVSAAGFQQELLNRHSIDELKREAAVVENQFVLDAGNRIDDAINDLAERNSRWIVRIWYEVLFVAYLLFVVYRVGWNFFYESFMTDAALLSSDFYLAAGLFLVLWSVLLVTSFTRRLRRGMRQQVDKLVNQMVDRKLDRGLFPELEEELRNAQRHADTARQLQVEVNSLRDHIARPEHLAARKASVETQPVSE